MKLNFDWKNDGTYHQYCMHCHTETVESILEEGKTYYFCKTCNQRHERSIIIDPAVKWWVAGDGEYWHESAGIFIRDREGKFLFYDRLKFPFVVTVPAGHVDAGEEPLESAKREAKEEVGLDNISPALFAKENIVGDSCRRGCDAHHWNAFLVTLEYDQDVEVTAKDEGEKPVWLSLDEALEKDLAFPVRYLITRYKDKLQHFGHY